MRIYHMGHSIKNIFPPDTTLIGRYLDDVFRLVRPDIVVEWNRVRSRLPARCSRANVCSVSLDSFLRSTYRLCHRE